MNLRRMIATWTEPGPTAVLEHGANPGLISHFTKQALLDIAAQRARRTRSSAAPRPRRSRTTPKAQEFNHLAHQLGVKVIHCSERDTQITDQPKQVDEFVNTWSVEGFREEGTTTAEMGWGTHEKELPALAFEHPDGPKSQICLARMGINTFVATWVPPDHHIVGMVVRHGEAFTITEKLTVWEDGKAVYRPTVHYAYCPCDAAIASLHELRGYDYELQPRIRIMTDEITSGADILGALVMGHPYQSWWCGIGSRHRGVAPPRAASERDDDAGGDLGRGRLHVDDRESRARGCACPTTCRTTTCSTSASRTSASSSRSRPTGPR